MQKLKEEASEKYVPSVEDFTRVLSVSKGAEYAMLLSFLHLAARKTEILSLEWKDVDLDKRRVRIWTRKRDGGRESDYIPMSEELFMSLREQRFKTGLSQWVFPNPETGQPYTWHGKFLPRLCKAAGVKEFGYHSLRHLAACLLGEAGEPLAYIQAMLRHKNATTTSRYLHSLQGIRAPKEGVFRGNGAQGGAYSTELQADLIATR